MTPTSTFPPPTATSEQLIQRNMGLARQQAWKYHRKTGQPYDDLEAIAYLGLIRGCRRYDPERVNPGTGRPYALSTIVVPFIAGEILHWFRDRGHAIRFPSRWREQWGKVQRLLSDPDLSAQDVAEQSGLSVEELGEMLAAMTGTSNLDDLHGADACHGPEVEISVVAPLQDLVRRAWANIHQGDRGQLLTWWGNPRKAAYPRGPLQQFHGRLRALLRGQSLSQVLQLSLSLGLQATPAEPRKRPPRRRRSREELEAAALRLAEMEASALQLGLVVG